MEEAIEEKENCAQTKMLEFVYKNLQYPNEARKNNIQGLVVVQFVVTKEGDLNDIKIVRKLNEECDKEAERVIHLMNEMEESWIPAMKGNKAIDFKYSLPVNFRLYN